MLVGDAITGLVDGENSMLILFTSGLRVKVEGETYTEDL